MSMGKSPVDIRQVTETESSTFAGSSPKLKGVILGGTKGSNAWDKFKNNCKIKQNTYRIITIYIFQDLANH